MTLSPEEHKAVVKAAVEVGGNELMVVAGVTSNNYKEVIKLSLNAAEAGAKCVMIPPPYYYVIKQEDIYRWYKLMAEEIKDIVIMPYTQSWRAEGTFVSGELMGKLAGIENIVSVKHQAKELKDYIRDLGLYSKRFVFIDNSIGYRSTIAHMHGATGYITGPAVYWPEFEAKY